MNYPCYPEYKPSGVEWLGDVPAHWGVRRADFVLEESKTSVSATSLNGQDVFHYSIPVVQETGTGRIEEGDGIDSNKIAIRAPTLLVSKLNPRKGTIVIAFPDTDRVTVASSEFVPLVPRATELRYVFYMYSCEHIRQRLDAVVQSATRSHQRANPDEIKKLYWTWPSLDEQRAIATFLDRETARIDALIARKRRLIELLAEKRAALISQAVTKGLNPDAPMKDSGVEWLGEIPAHWEVKPLKRSVKFIEGPGILAVDFMMEGVPLLRIAGIGGHRASLEGCNFLATDMVKQKWEHFRVRIGDLLISGSASTGFCSEVDETTEGAVPYTGIIIVRPRQNEATKNFIRWFFISNQFLTQALLAKTGSTIQHFGPSHLSRMTVAVPPLAEQSVIADYLDREISKLDVLRTRIEVAIEKLKEYRAALIADAVTGKIDVRSFVKEKEVA